MSTPFTQSLSWWCFQGRGVEAPDLLRAAKEIGYASVELIPESLWDAARDAGLTIVTHGGHGSISHGLNDPAQFDRIAGELDASLALAAKYEVPNLIVFSGERRPGLSEQEGIDNTVTALKKLAPAAEDAGVTLIIELLNSRVDHPGYQCDHTEWGVEVCKLVNSPRVKLLYDIYHMQIMEGDLIRTIETYHEYFAHYHTAGNPGRRDMDETQEIYYPAVARAIAATGYQGCIGHEFIPKGEPIAALEHAFKLCDV